MTKRLTLNDKDYYLILGLKSKYQTESIEAIIRLEGMKPDNLIATEPPKKEKIPSLDELIDSGKV